MFDVVTLALLGAVLVNIGGTHDVANVTKTVLANGCTMTRSNKSNPNDMYFTMPNPFLNCSHLNKEIIDLSGVDNDTASISLTHNRFGTFRIEDLERFPKLTKLDMSHSNIKQLVASSSKPQLKSVYFLFLGHNQLTSIPSDIFKSFPELRSLELSGNKIKTVTDNAFADAPNLMHVGLGSNPLSSISPNAWKNLTDKIHMMSLHDAGLKEVPAFVANMSRLIFLSISNNEISEIKEYAFNGTKSLRWLELSGNMISVLNPKSFVGPNGLHSLDLSDNDLESLPENVFSEMDDDGQMTVELFENPLACDCDLRWFKRWTTEIHSEDIRYKCQQPKRNHGKKGYEIEEEDFTCDGTVPWEESCVDKSGGNQGNEEPTTIWPSEENNICPTACTCFDSKGQQYAPDSNPGPKRPRLPWHGRDIYPHVDCTGANLGKIPPGIRSDVRTLTLAENKLITVDLADFKPFTSLRKLDLRKNGMLMLKNNSKTILKSVTSLTIQHNKLTALGPQHLRSFPNLEVLRMFNNKITKIPKNMFSFNRKLNRVYMGGNPVQNFDPTCLRGLNLYSLSLRNLSLTQVPTLYSKNLTYIELSDNRITTLRNGSFQGAENLYRLTLDNNLISTVGRTAFKQATKLRFLDLSENKITSLPKGVFDDLSKDRLTIELWMNNIACDCKMKWFKSWIEELEEADPMTEIRFGCMLPIRVHGKTSDQMSPDEFVCKSTDATVKAGDDIDSAYYEMVHGHCYSNGQMALAVILTIFFMTLLLLFVSWCRKRRNRGYSKYSSHHESTAELDMNM